LPACGDEIQLLVQPPAWPLTRAEIESFGGYGLTAESIVDFFDDEDRGPVRRWRAWFTARHGEAGPARPEPAALPEPLLPAEGG
jgi:hypothetical protein